jgi:hypothetical protein
MLPWSDMLRAALAAGIPPHRFWRLSLREWHALSRGSDTLNRDWLTTLMNQFPDMETD